MAYKNVTPPAGGKISIQAGKLNVPDNPILPFIRGDGTGKLAGRRRNGLEAIRRCRGRGVRGGRRRGRAEVQRIDEPQERRDAGHREQGEPCLDVGIHLDRLTRSAAAPGCGPGRAPGDPTA